MAPKPDSFTRHTTQMARCTICHGLPLGPKPLFKLHPEARILIAGQAPGRITHERGRTFDDVSGDRLRSWLGVTRDTFFNDPRIAILPVGLCYPGTGRSGDLPPRPECAPAWRDQTIAMLGKLDLTLIFGRYALDWHLPQFRGKPITHAVSCWRETWPEKLVLPHPSPRNNRWLSQNPWVEKDLIPSLQTRISALLEG